MGGPYMRLNPPERLVEHQQMGTRYMVHVLVVKTYPDRLHIAGLLQGMEAGTPFVFDGRSLPDALKEHAAVGTLGSGS